MVNIRRVLGLLLLLFSVILQSGCDIAFSGRTEISRIEFIRAIGVDKCLNSEDKVRLTIATQSVKSESGGVQQKKSEILYSEGNTVFEAVRNFWNYMDKRPFWGHLEYVLIGEEAAKDGLLKYIDFFGRDPEVRSNLKVYIMNGLSAGEVIVHGNSDDKFIFDRLEGIAENQWGQSVYNVEDLIEVMYILDNEYLSLYLPCIKLAQFTIGEKNTNEAMDIVMGGFAIFNGDKLAGYLDEEMGRGLNWLRNKIKSGVIAVKSPQGNGISLEIIESKSKLEPKIVDGQLSITMRVDMSSNIAGLRSSEDVFTEKTLGYLEKQQEQTIKEEIESVIKFAQEKKLDFFSTADVVFHRYPIKWEDNYQENWKKIFSKIDFKIIVNSKIVRTYDIKQPSRSKVGGE